MDKRLANKLFYYKDGKLYNRVMRGSRALRHSEAGSLTHEGYRRVIVCRKEYRVHHIVFLMHHGHMPKIIDHTNGVRDDNRIDNLREATVAENCRNSKIPVTNTSGVKGVYWCRNKWRAMIRVGGEKLHLGLFDDLELAEFVVSEARDKYHGDFARQY